MFSTDFIFRQQENLVDNQKCLAGFRPLCNKTLFLKFIVISMRYKTSMRIDKYFGPHYLYSTANNRFGACCNKHLQRHLNA